MTRIFWDTNIFIYFLEGHTQFGPAVRSMFERMLRRGDQLITSAMTVGETLVKPRELQDLKLCKEYEDAITSTAHVVPFDLNAARIFSTLRLNRALRAPEVIQLSCAAAANVDIFITNDNRLHDLLVDGVKFIVPVDRVPF